MKFCFALLPFLALTSPVVAKVKEESTQQSSCATEYARTVWVEKYLLPAEVAGMSLISEVLVNGPSRFSVQWGPTLKSGVDACEEMRLLWETTQNEFCEKNVIDSVATGFILDTLASTIGFGKRFGLGFLLGAGSWTKKPSKQEVEAVRKLTGHTKDFICGTRSFLNKFYPPSASLSKEQARVLTDFEPILTRMAIANSKLYENLESLKMSRKEKKGKKGKKKSKITEGAEVDVFAFCEDQDDEWM
jgi:hypothetical protein